MAKKQTRRTISFNREVYEAAKRAADQQGKSIAHFTEDALRAAGVEMPATLHMKLDAARLALKNRLRPPKEYPPKPPKAMPSKPVLPPKPPKALPPKPPKVLPPKPPKEQPSTPPKSRAKVLKKQPPKRREGPIRRALGDGVANWAGEP